MVWPQKLQPNCVSLYGANPFLTDFNSLWYCSARARVYVWVLVCVSVCVSLGV